MTWEDYRDKYPESKSGVEGESNPMYGVDGEDAPWGNKERPEQSKRFSGRNNPFYGKEHSEETKKQISSSLEGRFTGQDSPTWQGGDVEVECEFCGNTLYRPKWNLKRKPRSFCADKDCRAKWLSKKYQGENHPRFKSNKDRLYSKEWTESLKEEVRLRDDRECQVCGKNPSNRKLDVHHIDGDKHNCAKSNLISLCRKHHAKAERFVGLAPDCGFNA